MEDAKRTIIIARILAVLVAVIGIYLIGSIVIPLIKNFLPIKSVFEIAFLFIFPIPAIALGCYCIYCSYHLWLKISTENVRRILFILSIIIFFVLITIFHRYIDKEHAYFLITLLMIPAGLFYLFLIKIFLNIFALPIEINWVQREKTVKRFFGIFAFFFYSSLMDLVMPYMLSEKDYSLPFLEPIVITAIFAGTIILSIAIYSIGIKIALRNKPKAEILVLP
jgi:hypothetical protein